MSDCDPASSERGHLRWSRVILSAMRLPALIAAAMLSPMIAFADPTPGVAPVPSAAVGALPGAKATCKQKIVGKGLERHSVCVIEGDVQVTASNKPAVVVVPRDPRVLVGRPRSNDRLDGLSHQLR
jgi:hypothetical protein